MIKRKALESALFCLQMSGQDPYKLQTVYAKFINGLWVFFTIFFTPCIATEIFAGSDKLTNIADAASNMFTYVAAIYKVMNLLRGRKIITDLLQQINEFSTSDVFDREWKRNIEISTVKKMENVCKLVIILYAICGSYYFIRPMILQQKILPVPIYMIPAINNISGSYYVIFLIETIIIAMIAINMMGHDCLVFALVYNIVIELRALKNAMTELAVQEQNEEEILRKLKIYVQYHNKLYKYIEVLNQLFSFFFLYQSFFTIVGVCIAFFLMSVNLSLYRYDDVFRFGILSVCVYSQMTLYCKGGADLAHESETLGQAIYESDWTSAFHPKVRTMMITIIHRSQKAAKLNAGGVFDMNLSSLTSVAKGTFSYFTLLRTLYGNNDLEH